MEVYLQRLKKTLNRRNADSVAQLLMVKLPYGSRPIEILTCGDVVRSKNSSGYTRLFDAELLEVVIDEADELDSRAFQSIYLSRRDLVPPLPTCRA